MCGLAGVFRAGGVEVGPVLAMTEALIHRGPDDVGLEVIRASGRPYAALGARRLSIVDVEGGHQPVSDPSGRFVVSMNGEIYNHQRLRREVAGGEPIFQSNGDTEVVSGLLAQCPLDQALPRLEGMFALAAVDTAERRLILARDRMGVKPLYWTKLPDGTIAWASELKGLRAHPAIQWALDVNSVNSYLLFEYIPTPGTIWAGVHKLEPGTWLEADARGVRTGRFWTPPVPAPGRDGHLGRWARSLYSSLQIAVHHRMSADVPVGYLLSGGLDSASVAAIAAKKSEDPIRTFSLAVDAPGFDEGPSARLAAASLGADHREARLGPGDLPGLLDEIADGLDEPLADSSLPATWRLMALVRESGLKCVLSGDGADESFAGYPTCVAHLLAPAAERAPGLVAALAKRLPVTHDGVTRDYMARRFADGLGLPWARRHQVWMGAWLPGELGVGPDDPVWGPVDAHARAADGTDPASRAMYLDQRLYLSDGVLVKVDRASMAHGVEVRSPFLDRTVVELAADMSIAMKLRIRPGGIETKRVLREAVADLVPAEVLARPKQGFGTPVGPWLRGPCRHLLDGLVESVEGLVPSDPLRAAVRDHLDGRADHRRRIWSALVLGRWRVGRWGPG